ARPVRPGADPASDLRHRPRAAVPRPLRHPGRLPAAGRAGRDGLPCRLGVAVRPARRTAHLLRGARHGQPGAAGRRARRAVVRGVRPARPRPRGAGGAAAVRAGGAAAGRLRPRPPPIGADPAVPADGRAATGRPAPPLQPARRLVLHAAAPGTPPRLPGVRVGRPAGRRSGPAVRRARRLGGGPGPGRGRRLLGPRPRRQPRPVGGGAGADAGPPGAGPARARPAPHRPPGRGGPAGRDHVRDLRAARVGAGPRGPHRQRGRRLRRHLQRPAGDRRGGGRGRPVHHHAARPVPVRTGRAGDGRRAPAAPTAPGGGGVRRGRTGRDDRRAPAGIGAGLRQLPGGRLARCRVRGHGTGPSAGPPQLLRRADRVPGPGRRAARGGGRARPHLRGRPRGARRRRRARRPGGGAPAPPGGPGGARARGGRPRTTGRGRRGGRPRRVRCPGAPRARAGRDTPARRPPRGAGRPHAGAGPPAAPNTGRQHRTEHRPAAPEHRPAAQTQHRSPAAPRTSRESREGTARNPMSTDQVYVMPASPSQLGLWLLSELEPTSSAYHVPLAVRLTGPLDPAALEEAVRLLGERHEILRTTFGTADGEVSQFIHPAPAWRMEHVALDHLTPEAAEQACRDHSAARAFAPFDLAARPLLRPVLYRLADDDHVLPLALHHSVTDGWSTGVIAAELSALYRHGADALPAPALQYADFAVWHRDWLAGGVAARQLDHWRADLADDLALDLPTDHPRPPRPARGGHRVTGRLPEHLTRRLRELAASQGTSLFAALHAAFAATLSRYSGQSEVRIGVPAAGRGHANTEDLIGFFANTLVVRTGIDRAQGFRALLGEVRTRLATALDHADVPFRDVVQALGHGTDRTAPPLFQAMV